MLAVFCSSAISAQEPNDSIDYVDTDSVAQAKEQNKWHFGDNAKKAYRSLERHGWTNKDSIAAKGKVARGIIDGIDWWHRTFDSYDTAFVASASYKFKVQLLEDNWIDSYSFDLQSGKEMKWKSPFTATVGASFSVLGLSLGFSFDISEKRKIAPSKRKVFSFEMSKSRINLCVRYIRNENSNTNVNREVREGLPDVYFNGINNKIWDITGYYIFNHRRYAQTAAYNYAKVQRRSAGSVIAGISVQLNNINCDLHDPDGYLPAYAELTGMHFVSNNYTALAGYGYNWVPARNFVVNITAYPSIGWRYGHQISACGVDVDAYGFALGFHSRAAVTYAYKHLVVSVKGHFLRELFHNNDYSFHSQVANFGLEVCYRF